MHNEALLLSVNEGIFFIIKHVLKTSFILIHSHLSHSQRLWCESTQGASVQPLTLFDMADQGSVDQISVWF